MKTVLRIILKLAGMIGMGIAAYIIVRWYMYWMAYYFIGSLKVSIIVGLLTFFMSPFAAIIDLFWHSFAAPTVEMCKYFLMYFIGGRVLFYIGGKLDNK